MSRAPAPQVQGASVDRAGPVGRPFAPRRGGRAMLKTVVDLTVPVLVFVLMTVVGLELTPDAFRRLARRGRLVALATAAQAVLWPLAAVALLAVLRPPPY